MITMTRRRLAATATALTLAAGLTACSDAAEPAAGPAPAASSTAPQVAEEASDHNDADTRFAQMMIVHHDGAMEMADLVSERAATEEVRALGERIAAAQGPEIELMSGWLTTWGEDVAADVEHGAMDHGGMDMDGMDMNGMDQEQAMASLSQLEGVDFDRAFLELMVAHHRGAIEMAEAHLADGANPEARELARTIIDDQTREITEMEQLLRDL